MGSNASMFDIGDYLKKNRLSQSLGQSSQSDPNYEPDDPNSLPPSDNPVNSIQNRQQITNPTSEDSSEGNESSTPPEELYKPGERMKKYEELMSKEPLHEDYHSSKLRSILSVLAGVGTGLAGGGVYGGMSLAHKIKEQPYTDTLQDYGQKLGQAKTGAEEESAENTSAQKYYQDLAKVQHEQAQANQENETAAFHQRGNVADAANFPNYLKAKQTEHPSTLVPHFLELTMNDGSQQQGKIGEGGKIVDLSENPIDPSSIKNVATKEAKPELQGQLGEAAKAHEIIDDNSGKYTPAQKKGAQTLLQVLTAGKESSNPVITKEVDNNGNATVVTTDPKTGKELNRTSLGKIGKSKESGDEDLKRDIATDRSKNLNSRILDTTSKPIEEGRAKLNRLEQGLIAANPVTDRLIAPELTNYLTGGSKLPKSELERAAGGETHLTHLQQVLNSFSTNPNAPQIPDAERQQLFKLVSTERQSLEGKSNIISDAKDKLAAEPDIKNHFKIVTDAQKALKDVDKPTQMVNYKGRSIPKVRNGFTFNEQTQKYEK